MTTAHPKVRIQYLRDSQAVYTANGAEGLRYATSGSVGLDLRACLEEDEAAIPAGGRLAIPSGIAVQRGTTAPTRRPHRAARFPARLAGGA